MLVQSQQSFTNLLLQSLTHPVSDSSVFLQFVWFFFFFLSDSLYNVPHVIDLLFDFKCCSGLFVLFR